MATNFDPLGSEIQVNSTIANDERNVDLGVATDGRFIAVYQTEFVGGDSDVYIQYLTAGGTLSGPENFAGGGAGASVDPAVAPRLGGGAAVVWTDEGAADGSASINLQVLDGGGALAGAALLVNDDLSHPLLNPDAALLANGEVVVVFEAAYAPGDHDIYLRVLHSDGLTFATADRVEVDASASANSFAPAVAIAGSEALIVYASEFPGPEGVVHRIVARVYDGNTGTFAGASFVGDLAGGVTDPDVAALAGGRFVVVWTDSGDDTIHARLVKPNGSPLGQAFVIGKAAGGNEHARVAGLPDGGFFVTWDNQGAALFPEDGSNLAVLGRRFDAHGKPAGDLFVVNSTAAGDQDHPAVAVNGSGRAFIAWNDSQSHSGADTDPLGVRGRGHVVQTDVVNGTSHGDTLRTYDLGETINGLGGNDRIFAMGGRDRVAGGAGNDLIAGGLGHDVLAGGAGRDVFDFNAAGEAGKGAGRDVITDFHPGHDEIDLSTIDASTHLAGNQRFTFIGGEHFHHVAGELRFSGGLLQGDTNGNGVADLEIKVIGAALLTDADLVL